MHVHVHLQHVHVYLCAQAGDFDPEKPLEPNLIDKLLYPKYIERWERCVARGVNV